MKELSTSKKNVLRFFISRIVPRFKERDLNLTYIKLVFNRKDLDTIKNIILEEEKLNDGYNILEENYNEYNNSRDDSINYIVIPDYKKLADFLYRVNYILLARGLKSTMAIENYMMTVWIRMGVEDLNNINNFFNREVLILYNDDFFEHTYEFFEKKDDYDLCYEVSNNPAYFETNKRLTFYLGDLVNNKKYSFPSIHYGLVEEDGKKKCFLYGIQTFKDANIKDLNKILRKDLKSLWNDNVTSPVFILTLKYFMELLKAYNIYDIEVPLLQVFNYNYHLEMDEAITRTFTEYSDSEKELYENDLDDSVEKLNYLHDKKMYYRFHNKSEEISKNKTERFIDTILLMQEKFDNIEILNEPLLQGDSLIIKIKDNNKILKKEM